MEKVGIIKDKLLLLKDIKRPINSTINMAKKTEKTNKIRQ